MGEAACDGRPGRAAGVVLWGSKVAFRCFRLLGKTLGGKVKIGKDGLRSCCLMLFMYLGCLFSGGGCGSVWKRVEAWKMPSSHLLISQS